MEAIEDVDFYPDNGSNFGNVMVMAIIVALLFYFVRSRQQRAQQIQGYHTLGTRRQDNNGRSGYKSYWPKAPHKDIVF